MKRVLLALVVCVHCHKTPPTSSNVSDAIASASASARPPTLTDVRKQAADAGYTPPPDFAARRRAYFRAIARGRKATIDKRYADAEAAFSDALTQMPNDARALSEKGYANLLAGKLDEAAADFDAAREAGEPRELAAQTWFNIGLVREKQNKPAEARAAFAISQRLVPSTAAAAKLAGATACEAEVTRTAESLKVAKGWVEADSLFSGTATTEKAAHDELCRQIFTASPEDVPSTACDGDPPYYVTRDYMWFTFHAALVFRGPGTTLFFDDLGMEGGWPAKCQASHGSTGHVEAELLSIEETVNGQQSVMVSDAADAIAKGADPDSIVDEWNAGHCADGAGTKTWTFYDKATGDGLLTVKLAIPVGEENPAVTVSVDKRVVKLEGGGCHDRYDLATSP